MSHGMKNSNEPSENKYSEQDMQLLDLVVRLLELDPTPQQLEQALERVRKMVHRIQTGRAEMN